MNHETLIHRAGARFRAGSFLAGCLGWALAGWLGGCAGPNANRLTLDTVGPIDGGYIGRRGMARGFLQVYSATTPVNDGGIVYNLPTPYSIYTPEGKHFKGVVNNSGPGDQKPMTVELPPGRYQIFAMAPGFGQVKVPVQVDSLRLTLVYLDRWGRPPSAILGIPAAEAVRLPDDRVVGRQAKLPAAPPASAP